MSPLPPIPDPIQWYEGMLLTPQHFQQHWLRQDRQLHYHTSRLSPFFYGVTRIEIDHAMLVVGIFRVLALEAVLPDGLMVAHPVRGGGDLQIDLQPYGAQLKEGPVTVHAVVPILKPGAAAGGDLARYGSIEGPPAVDENTGDNEQTIARLQPRLSLQVGNTVPQKYGAVPLARVVYSREAFRLLDYMPPTVAATPDSLLSAQCRVVSQRLREKAAFLAGRFRNSGGGVQGAVLSETRHTIQCLVAGLPRLEAVLGIGAAHPIELFTALSGIAGDVATLGSGLVPPQFDNYRHDDIMASAQPMLEYILRMIDTVVETHVGVSFTAHEEGFRLKLLPAWLQGHGLVIGVRLAPGQSEGEADTWIQESAIASANHLGALRQRRLRGTPRTRIERDDRLGVIPERGVVLYRIAEDPSLIGREHPLEVIGPSARPGARPPAEIVLYVVPAAGPAGPTP